MDDAEFERHKGRLEGMAEKWIRPIGLGWWKVDFEYWREGFGGADSSEHWQTLARCHSRWEYLTAKVEWDMQAVASLDDDEELEKHVVHELVHIFLAEMRVSEPGDGHEERVAETLAKALMWAREAGGRDALDSPTCQPPTAPADDATRTSSSA